MAAPHIASRDRERLLMHLYDKSRGNPGQPLELTSLASELGFDPQQARVLFVLLTNSGWAEVKYTQTGGLVQITGAGVNEALRLRLPFWQRWLAKEGVVVGIVVGVVSALITAIVTAVLGELFKRMLPP